MDVIALNSSRSPSIAMRLARVNWAVIALLCGIAGFGVAALYSAGDGSMSPWAERHAIRFLIGLGLLLFVCVLPIAFVIAATYPIYAVSLTLLALVPVFGEEASGASRWLSAGSVQFQPSEFMKGALPLALARYYQWLPLKRVSHPLFVLIPIGLIATPIALTLQQPDLGTALLLAAIGLGLMMLAGVSIWYFVAGGLGAVLSAPLVHEGLHEYQRQRILTFLDPERDPLGSGYQILQAKIALASGGISGRGYMEGSQGQLNFVPEKHTDFIFAIIGEEWGFVGAVILIAAFALLTGALWLMALKCGSRFGRLTIGGTALVLFTYAFVNIAMVTGLMPVVGVPLPLISHGGTSMLTFMTAFGVAMCAYVNRERDIRPRDLATFL